MSGWYAEDLLYLRLGTETPNWSLAADSDTLFLAAGRNEQAVAVRLKAEQLAQIHAATSDSVRTTARLTILGASLQLYLVGRKINDYVWKGAASSDPDFLRAESGSLDQASSSIIVDLAERRGKQRQVSL
ncbi:hypothetical protein [Paraburkholderia phenazinium]|jgi:hypothetical protein|uniref:Uncharacterized protein n=1 Tax=Paraburkholderia phenazinium TaxID=60549 RepID=A0A1G7VE95_9BURK|nr:hypothetical protein [Paraburkholderia phenazinium]SDG58027.1 hypothetical protein SAMN05216466_10432 [Paraburkholderia phenazinium]